MILYNFGDDKIESSLNFYNKILCRVSGLYDEEKSAKTFTPSLKEKYLIRKIAVDY